MTARAGNRRFWCLTIMTALRAHTKAPYKTDLHRKTRRALNRPWAARTEVERRGGRRGHEDQRRVHQRGLRTGAAGRRRILTAERFLVKRTHRNLRWDFVRVSRLRFRPRATRSRTKIVQGWPKLWANFKALIGTFTQSVGPSLAIWASPVQFPFRRLRAPSAARWGGRTGSTSTPITPTSAGPSKTGPLIPTYGSPV
jgi:hypothetical protein